jgi:hypothetical protein
MYVSIQTVGNYVHGFLIQVNMRLLGSAHFEGAIVETGVMKEMDDDNARVERREI